MKRFLNSKVIIVSLITLMIGLFIGYQVGSTEVPAEAQTTSVKADTSSSSAQTAATKEKADKPKEEKSVIVKLNQPLTFDGREVTVSKVEQMDNITSDVGNEDPAPEGSTWIVLHYSIKNTGDTAMNYEDFVPVLQSADGTKYSHDDGAETSYTIYKDINDDYQDTLNAGFRTSAITIFQVPKDEWAKQTAFYAAFGDNKGVQIK